MDERFVAGDVAALKDASHRIMELLADHPVVAFYGEMGAGKTTLIQALCRQLGIRREVTSPTFALVYEYHLPEGNPVYHFDFYRLNDPVEALDFGLEEYLDSGHPCLMEWPEKIGPLLPADAAAVKITVLPGGSREILIQTP